MRQDTAYPLVQAEHLWLRNHSRGLYYFYFADPTDSPVKRVLRAQPAADAVHDVCVLHRVLALQTQAQCAFPYGSSLLPSKQQQAWSTELQVPATHLRRFKALCA